MRFWTFYAVDVLGETRWEMNTSENAALSPSIFLPKLKVFVIVIARRSDCLAPFATTYRALIVLSSCRSNHCKDCILALKVKERRQIEKVRKIRADATNSISLVNVGFFACKIQKSLQYVVCK